MLFLMRGGNFAPVREQNKGKTYRFPLGLEPMTLRLYARESATLYHLFYFYPFSKTFWSDFESFWHLLTREIIQLSLQDITVGVLTTKRPSHHLLNN